MHMDDLQFAISASCRIVNGSSLNADFFKLYLKHIIKVGCEDCGDAPTVPGLFTPYNQFGDGRKRGRARGVRRESAIERFTDALKKFFSLLSFGDMTGPSQLIFDDTRQRQRREIEVICHPERQSLTIVRPELLKLA